MQLARKKLIQISQIDGFGGTNYKKIIDIIHYSKKVKKQFSFLDPLEKKYILDLSKKEFFSELKKQKLRGEIFNEVRSILNAKKENNSIIDQENSDYKKIFLFDKEYPDYLLNTKSPPIKIVCKGDIHLLKKPLISIVGTRYNTDYGKREVIRLVRFCRNFKLTTVSGLAFGIDSLVHRFSMEEKVPTIAVVPKDIEDIVPASHQGLSERIVQSGGLLVSEFGPGENSKFGKHSYPMRNRIISGLSPVTVVIEAGETSGALITADFAIADNRSVYVAVGDPLRNKLKGNLNLLLQPKAKPLTADYSGLMADLVGINPKKLKKNQEARFLQKIYKIASKKEIEIIRTILEGQGGIYSLFKTLKSKEAFADLKLNEFNVILAKMVIKRFIIKDEFGNLRVNYEY
jgi:DNA processing protein